MLFPSLSPVSPPPTLSPIAPLIRETWYGPVTATLPIAVAGNPYDPVANDVRVVFTARDGTREERLAYFDGAAWRATLAAQRPGTYRATVMLNGKPIAGEVAPVELRTKMTGAYVRRGGAWGLATSDGKPYWPLGYNVAWTNDEVPDIAAELRRMGAAGANWSRVWTTFWDGKAAYMSPEFVRDGTIDLRAWTKWDPIVRAAEEANVPFQFCLFHHGPWSSDVNTNWPDSPWRKANGGFLEKPEEFFTDPKAIARAKAAVRYTIARYAHSPGIMAWEIFNEVEWVDGIKRDPENVGRWHDMMATYIRSLDPYHHLVTTSSRLDLPIWRAMDVYEPHAYPPAVGPFLLTTEVKRDKPFFFGEVGPGDLMGGKARQIEAVRGGIWNALFSGHSGAAEYWTWDLVVRDDLRREWTTARRILDRSGVIGRGPMTRKILDLHAGSGADLTIVPAAGWAKAGQVAFDLPREAGAVASLPQFIQGEGNRTMMPSGPSFAFTADRAGETRVRVTEVSANRGGHLELRLDGKSIVKKEFTAGAKPNETLVAPFGPGRHTLELVNDGPDWVTLGGVTFTGIGPNASGVGMAKDDFAMVRILRADPTGSAAPNVSLADLGLTGRASVEVTDLDTGKSRDVAVDMAKGRLSLSERDAVLVVRKAK